MPTTARTRLECRRFICCCCGNKKGLSNNILDTNSLLDLVKSYANRDLDPNLLLNPTGLCNSCKTLLYNAKKGIAVSSSTLNAWLLTSERLKMLPRVKGKYSFLIRAKINNWLDILKVTYLWFHVFFFFMQICSLT